MITDEEKQAIIEHMNEDHGELTKVILDMPRRTESRLEAREVLVEMVKAARQCSA